MYICAHLSSHTSLAQLVVINISCSAEGSLKYIRTSPSLLIYASQWWVHLILLSFIHHISKRCVCILVLIMWIQACTTCSIVKELLVLSNMYAKRCISNIMTNVSTWHGWLINVNPPLLNVCNYRIAYEKVAKFVIHIIIEVSIDYMQSIEQLITHVELWTYGDMLRAVSSKWTSIHCISVGGAGILRKE